jgi:prephenate dehydratase
LSQALSTIERAFFVVTLQEQTMRIAYQGAPGAFSHIAALQHDPRAVAQPHVDFAAAAAAVTSGRAQRAILPVENSIAGPVEGALAALADRPELEVIAEFEMPIHLCLLALPGADIASIRYVESHPIALAQCARWLSAHKLTPRGAEDTAGAARELAQDRDWTRAAVAPAEAAERYGLEILARDIADHRSNRTRFVIVALRAVPHAAAA